MRPGKFLPTAPPPPVLEPRNKTVTAHFMVFIISNQGIYERFSFLISFGIRSKLHIDNIQRFFFII